MKDIKGYEGRYAATADGRIWSHISQKYLKGADNGHGYLCVQLSDASGERHTKKIHRLIAETLIPNPEGLIDVNHKDNCRTNNSIDNLEWVTRKENCNNEGGNRNFNRRRLPVRCVETGEVYANQAEASRATGIGRYNISNCITGKQQTAGGYHWERIEENVK